MSAQPGSNRGGAARLLWQQVELDKGQGHGGPGEVNTMKKTISMKIGRRRTFILALGGMEWRRAGRLVGTIRDRRLALYWAGRLALIVAKAY